MRLCCCQKSATNVEPPVDMLPTIDLKQGQVVGTTKTRDGKRISIYNDIPFAKCSRFQQPEPYGAWEATWDGTVDTRRVCMSTALDGFTDGASATIKPLFKKTPSVQCETSLHLSVTCPNNDNKSKPVMVWIHGGGWVNGGVSELDYSMLSAQGDVIIVALSYRMGLAGFAFGNWALFDHLEGLRWVKDNISSFGGDPNNVTIFGQSSGGWSVDALMSSPLSVGLFHRAIAQSGSLKTQFLKFGKISENPVYPHLMEKYKQDTMESLQEYMTSSLSVDDMNNLTVELFVQPQFQTVLLANWDGEFFVENPMTQKTYPNKVPFITGQCDIEFGLLHTQLFGAWNSKEIVIANLTGMNAAKGVPDPAATAVTDFDRICDTYPPTGGNKNDIVGMVCRYLGDGGFHGGFARAETLDSPVWCFEVAIKSKMLYEEPFKNGNEIVDPEWSSASHCTDLIYMFGYPLMADCPFPEGRYFSDEEKELSVRMMTVWSDFARTGVAGWSTFDNDTQLIKEFNTHDRIKSGHDADFKKRHALWKSDYQRHLN